MFLDQPKKEHLGTKLITALAETCYNRATVLVAYAKQSGVNRIAPYLEEFHKKGGTIRLIIGIDQQQTTYEALSHLLKLSQEIYIFHSEGIFKTFHVKCYWLSGEECCWYSIGSNNLTAGGLFDNYELSSSEALTGDVATNKNNDLEEIFTSYIYNAAGCCHKLDTVFLDELFENGYVVKEAQQRQQHAEIVNRSRTTSLKRKKLFGTERIPAPSLPAQDGKRTTKKADFEQKTSHEKQLEEQVTPREEAAPYLIRFIPKGGDRGSQVHFTKDILRQYFRLSQGDHILIQQIMPDGNVGLIEHRQIVLSSKNKGNIKKRANENVKIELAGAVRFTSNYPEDLNQRPVLIMKKVSDSFFVYMILLAGDNGYESVNARLRALPKGRSLQFEIIDEMTFFSFWNDCPIA